MVTQFFASIAFAVPASIIFALAAHGAEIKITPQTQPDCSVVCCTQDGVGQPPEQEPIILPAPYIGVGTEQD